ncbi:hypothetical protein CC86DRAFT_409623 [Ophiobolus disseminans]|uniref:Uncharacterized protein n=1 Tax=Ophiobolus disseminans TaxID=1469910 RepID=A0A6A6ZQY2_9PLEO|nr:hypothetical protein CC86DRAFT_409623 [Ophiobolus disseminans]
MNRRGNNSGGSVPVGPENTGISKRYQPTRNWASSPTSQRSSVSTEQFPPFRLSAQPSLPASQSSGPTLPNIAHNSAVPHVLASSIARTVRCPSGLYANFVLAKQRDEQTKGPSRQRTEQVDPISRPHQLDPRDAGAPGRSNNMSNLRGGATNFQNQHSQAGLGYGTATSSSSSGAAGRDWRIRSMQPPQNAAPVMTTATGMALQGLINSGITTISVANDIERRVRDVHHPEFLRGVMFNPANQREWYTQVLPFLETLEFVIESTVDLQFATDMFRSPILPSLFEAITKVNLPGQHWLPGIGSNRSSNPYFQILMGLPRLQEVTFTMHNSSVTDSLYTERQMIDIERVDSLRSRNRKVLPLDIIVAKYGFADVFKCRALRRLRLEYIECERARFHTKNGSAAEVMGQLQVYFVNGFAAVQMNVFVELVKVIRA